MKYMGSKNRIAKEILPILMSNDFDCYVELFVGGANLIDKMSGVRTGVDCNKYLIAMWQELQRGWVPPKEISREFYNECRQQYYKNTEIDKHIVGYVGFNGSYGGRFYDGGYAGVVQTKKGERNYPVEAWHNVMTQVPKIKDVEFICCDYRQYKINENSLIYCDPPYKDTKPYHGQKFITEDFWNYVRLISENNTVYVSGYDAPDDFDCVWEKSVKSSLSANGTIGGSKSSREKLFIKTGRSNDDT